MLNYQRVGPTQDPHDTNPLRHEKSDWGFKASFDSAKHGAATKVPLVCHGG